MIRDTDVKTSTYNFRPSHSPRAVLHKKCGSVTRNGQ